MSDFHGRLLAVLDLLLDRRQIVNRQVCVCGNRLQVIDSLLYFVDLVLLQLRFMLVERLLGIVCNAISFVFQVNEFLNSVRKLV